jgi:two-component system NtrC family sensor kinase
MSIPRRLTLSNLAILTLLAVNLVIYFWSERKRTSTFEDLRNAVSRQILISSIQQSLTDYQKQVMLLSQITGMDTGGASPEEIAAFNGRLDTVEDQLRQMSALSDPSGKQMIETFDSQFRDLASSWRAFYENFGRNQKRAITEAVVHAEPLGHKVVQEMLPQLQQHEKESVESASVRFYDATRATDRLTVLIFVVSGLLAGVLALVSSRYFTKGLRALKTGADAIGGGNLQYRIPILAKDEFGNLAQAFNDMGARLHSARAELEQRQQDLQVLMNSEHSKAEELKEALQQLKNTQDRLLVQERMASLGVLTAGIAHEIKNPLNFVTNFAEVSVELLADAHQLLEKFGKSLPPEETREIEQLISDVSGNLQKIRDHGKRADSIVRGMLAHSREGSGQFQPTDVNALIEEAVNLAYHGMRAQYPSFNIGLENIYDPALLPIPVVPQDLSRAILNLVNNGCYAAHQRALKSTGFRPVLRCSTVGTENEVEIRVWDNGTGIPKDVLPKIFNPFFTTKPTGSGTGLGLSLSYQIIVDQHKGTLRVETQEGEFTEFILTLPKQPWTTH